MYLKVNQLNLFLFVSILISNSKINAQCSGGSNGGAFPAMTTTYQTIGVTDGTYYSFTASGGCTTYDFSFCNGGGSASFDSQLTILDNSGTYVGFPGYNDDACGLQSEILGWTPPAPGVYRLLVNTYSCNSSGNSGTLAFRENGPVLSSGGDYTLQSDATTATDPACIQLTANSTNQKGCAWDVNSTLDFNSDFTFDFTVNLGSNNGGADGMAFVIQNDPAGSCACGSSGNGFGAAGISNSLIVEIDTYLNTEDRDDGALMSAQGVTCGGSVDPDHIDIWLNGNVNPGGGCPNAGYPTARAIPSAAPLMNGGSLYDIENGNDHILRVAWNSGTGTFTAAIMNLALSTTYGTVSISAPDFDPMTVFGTMTPFFGFTAATGGLSNQQIYCNPPTLLPVEISDFNVDCNANGNELVWHTISERNNKEFTVLRSTDGLNFEAIGTVNGSGTSSEPNEYKFEDKNRPNKLCYYTFSQTDFDGTTKPSGFVRVVDCKFDNVLSVYPNPLKSEEYLKIDLGSNKEAVVRIFDLNGKVVYNHIIKDNLDNELRLDLNAGIYQVYLTSHEGRFIYSTKLVVID